MRTILVINSKGGAGKTTVSTNLAGYYAKQKSRTAILDCDPQGSSLQWLQQRPAHIESIHGANAAPPKGAAPLSSIKTWIPQNTETLIIDAPAGVKGLQLQELVRRSTFILIPVAPSPIDIHATTDFVKDLFLIGGARNSKAKIAIVANRVRNSSPVYEPLERFLTALKLPLLARISDSETYIRASEQGLSVFEMEEVATLAERQEFMPIFRWLEGQVTVSHPTSQEADISGKVVHFEKTGKFASLRANGKTLLSSILSATGKFKNLS
ncbi:MAG: AAA family ATPase [Nitrosomonadales bacterium]|nr:AAA family ATPase [Nitrosomonadales bacterium]